MSATSTQWFRAMGRKKDMIRDTEAPGGRPYEKEAEANAGPKSAHIFTRYRILRSYKGIDSKVYLLCFSGL